MHINYKLGMKFNPNIFGDSVNYSESATTNIIYGDKRERGFCFVCTPLNVLEKETEYTEHFFRARI